MACISWFGLGYNQRSKFFRYMMVIASGFFVFSDLLIGNVRYGQIRIDIYLLIDITYVINISRTFLTNRMRVFRSFQMQMISIQLTDM